MFFELLIILDGVGLIALSLFCGYNWTRDKIQEPSTYWGESYWSYFFASLNGLVAGVLSIGFGIYLSIPC